MERSKWSGIHGGTKSSSFWPPLDWLLDLEMCGDFRTYVRGTEGVRSNTEAEQGKYVPRCHCHVIQVAETDSEWHIMKAKSKLGQTILQSFLALFTWTRYFNKVNLRQITWNRIMGMCEKIQKTIKMNRFKIALNFMENICQDILNM